ncbi:futalosine hydrolase [Streptomyces sp. p1417]|uniref:Futalosine hydrolase n=1 Tax=Streptomyces typhae TaxID=2681492 RepID=A0A6L6WV65_9ACTN|nr:futalosine hydrolase [Streptomyces typhae]
MVVQVQEGLGRLTGTAPLTRPPGPRVLIATAVPAERDAVASGVHGPDGTPAGPADARGSARPVSPGSPASPAAEILVAGVGPAAAAAATARALALAEAAGTPYDLVVSAGIGGGFPPDAPVGSLVVADAVTAADLGAETPDGFLPVTGLGFGRVTHEPPPALVAALAAATGAAAGTVLTVSTVTGTAERAAALRARHPGALAEAMEGFGVAEAAAAHGLPVLELRAVSNPVGPRDRAAWRIGDALAALTEAFGKLAPVLESWNRHD